MSRKNEHWSEIREALTYREKKRQLQKFNPENIADEIKRLSYIARDFADKPALLPKEAQEAIFDLIETLDKLSDEEYEQILSEKPELKQLLFEESEQLFKLMAHLLWFSVFGTVIGFILVSGVQAAYETANLVSIADKLTRLGEIMGNNLSSLFIPMSAVFIGTFITMFAYIGGRLPISSKRHKKQQKNAREMQLDTIETTMGSLAKEQKALKILKDGEAGDTEEVVVQASTVLSRQFLGNSTDKDG